MKIEGGPSSNKKWENQAAERHNALPPFWQATARVQKKQTGNVDERASSAAGRYKGPLEIMGGYKIVRTILQSVEA